MYRAGIWDGKWTGKDGKTGKREFGARDGKMGRDSVPISRFPVHFPFFFKPVIIVPRYIYHVGSVLAEKALVCFAVSLFRHQATGQL
jgi:hypothetical protein